MLCMEGNGPTQGKPRHMGALLAADTPFNADLVCAGLIGMNPADAPDVYKRQPESIPLNVNDLLDELISQSIKLVGNPVAMMNKDDKIKACLLYTSRCV